MDRGAQQGQRAFSNGGRVSMLLSALIAPLEREADVPLTSLPLPLELELPISRLA